MAFVVVFVLVVVSLSVLVVMNIGLSFRKAFGAFFGGHNVLVALQLFLV